MRDEKEKWGRETHSHFAHFPWKILWLLASSKWKKKRMKWIGITVLALSDPSREATCPTLQRTDLCLKGYPVQVLFKDEEPDGEQQGPWRCYSVVNSWTADCAATRVTLSKSSPLRWGALYYYLNYRNYFKTITHNSHAYLSPLL